MRNIETAVGKAYAVTTSTECTITTPDGVVIAVCPPGQQTMFIAPTNPVVASVDEAHVTESFKSASPSAAGGGTSITFDDLPTAGSGNAVTSNGVYVSLQEASNNINLISSSSISSVALGKSASASGDNSSAFGFNAKAGKNSTAFGTYSNAGQSALAIGGYSEAQGVGAAALGHGARASAQYSMSIGRNVLAKDSGAVVIGVHAGNFAWNAPSQAVMTQYYKITAGSPLSVEYLEGESGEGYIEHQNGRIVRCGLQKSSALYPLHPIDSATPFTPTL